MVNRINRETKSAVTAAEKRKEKHRLNKRLATLANKRMSLSDWLKAASEMHEDLHTALEGIWCGTEGRQTTVMPGWNAMICVGWYNGKVEWAYIS
jgi:hypothetical protein